MRFVYFFVFLIATVGFGQNTNTNGVVSPQSNSSNQLEELREESAPVKATEADKKVPSANFSTAQTGVTYSQKFQAVYQQSTHHTNSRSATPAEAKEMEQNAAYFVANQPKSFEANYFVWLSGRYNMNFLASLKKAYSMKSSDVSVIQQVAAAEFIQGKSGDLKKTLEKLKEVKTISEAQIYYGADLLQTIPQNGLVVVHGFSDFQAVTYNQLVKGFRADVTVISLDFLQSQSYRESLSKTVEIPSQMTVDVNFFGELVKMNQTLPVVYSATIPSDYFEPLKANLFVRGLGFAYSRTNIDFGIENAKNFSKMNLWNVRNAKSGKTFLESNYLPFLISAKNYLASEGKDSEAQKIAIEINKLKALN